MKIIRVTDNQAAAVEAANLISQRLTEKPALVLGLATGSTPLPTYQLLIEAYQNNQLSFNQASAFNLDEYCGLPGTHPQSYRYFMKKNLFKNINIDQTRTFIPDGLKPMDAERYDRLIAQAGGIDLQLLGLGINGHIGFNEPGTSFESITHVVDLTPSTINANARFFKDASEVPTQAVSMGLKSIMQAKEVLLIATGLNKAEAVKALVEGRVSEEWPCTILQNHPHCTVIIDEAAASQLTK